MCFIKILIALKTNLGRYVVANATGVAIFADRTSVGNWEQFGVYLSDKLAEPAFAFRAHTDNYVVAEANLSVNADRIRIGTYETFIVEAVGNGDGQRVVIFETGVGGREPRIKIFRKNLLLYFFEAVVPKNLHKGLRAFSFKNKMCQVGERQYIKPLHV